ncbi:MAG: zinc ribbon domain-containing protein [bacterium]|nr:zinc ribbon domain-containing protein [bacterium]
MGFEKQTTSEASEPKEKGRKLLFEVNKKVGGMDVSIGIERGGGPASGLVDLENRKVEARVTPQDLRKGFELISDFLKSSKAQKVRDKVIQKMNEATEKMEIKRQKRQDKIDKETVKDYAEQEGMTEKEVIEEILGELQKDNEGSNSEGKSSCSKCGVKTISDNQNFCINCGSKLR